VFGKGEGAEGKMGGAIRFVLRGMLNVLGGGKYLHRGRKKKKWLAN